MNFDYFKKRQIPEVNLAQNGAQQGNLEENARFSRRRRAYGMLLDLSEGDVVNGGALALAEPVAERCVTDPVLARERGGGKAALVEQRQPLLALSGRIPAL